MPSTRAVGCRFDPSVTARPARAAQPKGEQIDRGLAVRGQVPHPRALQLTPVDPADDVQGLCLIISELLIVLS